MDRRTLLTGSLALLAPFAMMGRAFGSTQRENYSPYHKGLGKAIKTSMSIEYNLESMYELGTNAKHFRYIEFPTDVKVTIEYEKGDEVWAAFNARNDQIRKFSMKEFFKSKFVNGTSDYGGHIDYLGLKFKLASVCVTD